METKRKAKRFFTPEQKFEILKDVEKASSVKEGLERHALSYSVYRKWKRQLEVGVAASLRNSKPVKSADTKLLERENRTLKEMVLNLSHELVELKKELRLA